jgi:serine/threonine-protein kinase
MIAAWAVAVVAIAAAAAGWLRRTPEPPFRRFDLVFGPVTPNPGSEVVVSPDGSMIALSGEVGGERAIYLRHLDGDPEFRKLAGTESGAAPSFSPDNQWIVFRKNSDRSLVKISVGGGGAVRLVPGGKLDPYWPHWGTAEQIIFVTPSGAHRVAASGGEPVPMPKVQSRRIFLLPDGSGVLHSVAGEVSLYDFQTDSSVVLISSGSGAVYVPTGHLLYNTTDGGTFAVKFNLTKRRVEGTPTRVLERVGGTANVRGYSVSAAGVLVQHDAEGNGNAGTVNRFVVVDPGKGADTVRLPPGRRAKPRFSRDGRLLAMEALADARNGASDIYTLNLVTGTYTQLTFDGDNDEPVWSPDGKRILFDRVGTSGPGEDLYIKPADNSGPERRLTSMSSREVRAQQWMDDKTLVFDAITPDRGTDAFTIGADSGSVPVPYLKSPFNETEPQLSSDRKLVVFLSDEAGSQQVWMRDYPVPQGKWNVSRGDARSPRWSPDGKFVYFWRAGAPLDTLFRARVDRTPAVVVQAPEVVVAMDADGTQNWDLHPDGRRFIVALAGGAEAPTSAAAQQSRYLILQNWFSELRRLTAPRAK